MASFNRMHSSSSSFVSTRPWEYEVFLSFRGEDTRNNFTDYLHRALLEKHIKVFKDDKLKHGEKISEGLLKAIEESQIAVIIISKNFASSRWCLVELAKIMEYKRQIEVWPIFYHVDPSHVRNLKDSFAEAFDKHTYDPKVDNQEMETWKAALKEVGHMKGWHVQNNRPEAEDVEELSKILSRKLNPNFSNLYKDLVGMESRVEELKKFLCIGHDDVRCVGIYGMNGIGKTTLAKLIYGTTFSKFKSSCFLAEDEQHWKYGGVKMIDRRFISEKVLIVIDDMGREKHPEAFAMLEIALKDENRNWFGLGSRIIVTSSDYQLIKPLVDCKYGDCAFKVEELNHHEALELFSLKAFKKCFPNEGYWELSKDIVRHAEGLPLAIEVFGSFFNGKSMDEWRSGLKMLVQNLDEGILEKLKISFDGLTPIQKEMFLDIACFFNGRSSNWLGHVLESFGYYSKYNVEVFRDKSLIKIKAGKIWMHKLLVQMGQQIEKFEYKNRLWQYEDIIDVLRNNISMDTIKGIMLLLHGRDEEELNLEAFSKMTKLRMIEIIPKDSYFEDHSLEVTPKYPYPKDIFSRTRKWPWYTSPFKFTSKESYPLEFMPKRIQQGLGKLKWKGDLSKFVLSDTLCLMKWFQYPLYSLPVTFESNNLIELILPWSNVKKLWKGRKSFEKLQVIHLNYSINLVETPDFTNVPNLEKLEVSYCTRLSKVHPSIGFLKWLKLLDLHGCKSLKNLPENLGCVESLEELNISQTSVKKLPSSICSLKKLKILKAGGTLSNPISLQLFKSSSSLSSLESLSLEYCNLSDIMIPNNFDSLSSLKKLFLSGNKFKSIPKFVWKFSKLEELDLSYCNLLDGGIPNDIGYLPSLRILFLCGNKFKSVPEFVWKLSKLEKLDLSRCNLFDGGVPNDIGYLPSLRMLRLHKNKFEGIPEFVWKLSKLEILNLSYCNLLDGGIPNDINCLSLLAFLHLKGNKFTTISNNISQLPKLHWLDLRDNSKLQALPKLPCALGALYRSGCPLLDTSSMDKWGSGVRTWKNTFGVSYHGYDGKSHKILYMDSNYASKSSPVGKWVDVDVACGPTLEYEIHEWFETRSNCSYQIQGRMQKSEIWNLEGIALFIVYELRESSNSKGSNDSNPAIVEIGCQMRCERTGYKSLESRVVEVSPSGRTGFERRRNGVWVFVSNKAIRKCFNGCNSPESVDFTFPVIAKSPNIEVEYGIRGVSEADKEDWCRVLSKISFHGWAPKSFKDFRSHSLRTCYNY